MTLPLILTDGMYVFVVTALIMLIGALFWRPLFYLSTAFLIFSIYFFRNPDRICPRALHDSSLIVAPADGEVIDISDNVFGIKGYDRRLSIFLSVWDVHVNWTPIPGKIRSITYHPGTFLFAYLPKSAEENERNDIVIEHENGKSIMMRQIAGTIARRISCWVKPGESLKACEKVGMIRFGSRVDLFLPRKSKLFVQKGERVTGGETVIGQLT